MKEIAIIIPAYKAERTLPRTLGSIITQKVVDKIKVYIVGDFDGIDYNYLKDDFGKYVDIEILTTPKNVGSGLARQFGIDHSTEPFLIFVDADDTLATPFAAKQLLDAIKANDDSVVISGTFIEEMANGKFHIHQQDMLWVHGKIYRRAFLDKYNLTFNHTRANEDMGFNYKIKLLENPLERIGYIGDAVAYWHFEETSIVRENKSEYNYTKSIGGTVDNFIDIYHTFKDVKPNDRLLDMMTIGFIGIYYTFIAYAEKNYDYILEQYKKFYNEVYKYIESDELEKRHFVTVTNGRSRDIFGKVPHITLQQFKELLRE